MHVNQVVRWNNRLAVVTRMPIDQFRLAMVEPIGSTVERCVLSTDTIEETDMTFDEALDEISQAD